MLCFLALGTRRPHVAACTTATDAGWVARQFGWQIQEREPGAITLLIHDRDSTFAAGFDTVCAPEGIEVITTPVRAPNANAYTERAIRSVRAECPDHLRTLNRAHSTLVLRRYIGYDNHRRPHQGLGQALPAPLAAAPTTATTPEQVRSRPVLGGSIHGAALAT